MFFVDDFSVGNHSNIDGQSSSDGQFVWEAIDGGSGTELMRTNQNAFCQAAIGFSGRCVYRAEIDFPTNDYFVEADINVGSDDDMKMGLMVRKDSSATLTYYDCLVRADTDIIRIRKRVAGTFTTLQDNSFTFATSTWYTIRFEVNGSTLRTYVDGNQVGADLVDSSITTGTRCGLSAEVGGSLTKTGNFADFGGSGIELSGTLRETGGADERILFDLATSHSNAVRETGGGTDRIFYDFYDAFTAFTFTIRETAGGDDRPFRDLSSQVTYTLRESAEGNDRDDDGQVPAGAQATRADNGVVILTHIYDYFGVGKDWAFSDKRRTAPAHTHVGRVLSWGTNVREIPIPAGPPRLGRLTIEFDDMPDPDTGVQYFRSQFGARTPKGKRVDLKIGPIGGSESLFQTPGAGVIESVTFPPGRMRLEIVDARKSWLQKPMPGLINSTNFPNLPVNVKDGFSKWVLGRVLSNDLNEQGALPCVHVDTVNHWYDLARHSIADATIYTKTPDETVFQLTPYSYTLVEDVRTIDGLEYTFSFVQFASALPEGTEVRADIRGLPGAGGWGTVPADDNFTFESRNVVDHVVSIVYYVDALEKGRVRNFSDAFSEWNIPSMVEVRQQFEDAGYLSDYAITEPLTPEVILTQLMGTFFIHWFQDRFNKTKLAMTTAETPEDAPVFGDFHKIQLKSEVQELARDTRNRIYYHYAKIHEQTGRFAGHGTYDNTTDQALLTDSDGEPIIEAEEIDLHACRDEDVALLLAIEWSLWRDQDAHRVAFDLDLPSNLSKAELARDFLITNYGGLKEGGWDRERFFPYKMTDDYDRLKIRVEAIRRATATLPQPQAQTVGTFEQNSRISLSYVTGNKMLFAAYRDSRNDKKMVVLGKDADGESEPIDDGTFPALTNRIESFDSYRFENKIHIWTHELTTGRVAYHVFDMGLQVWEVLNDEILASNSDGDIGVTGTVLGDSEEPMVIFMGDREAGGPAVWDGMTIAGAGDYRRAYLSRLVGGSWTSPVMVGDPNDLEATFFPVGVHYNGAVNVRVGRAIAEADDWGRWVYTVDTPADVANTPELYSQRITPEKTLTVAEKIKFTASTWYTTTHVVGDPCVFEYAGVQYTAVPIGFTHHPKLYIWIGPGASGTPDIDLDLTGETGVQVQPDSFGTLNPPIAVRFFRDKIRIVMGTRTGSGDEWAAYKTISPPFTSIDPDPVTDPRDDQVGPTWPGASYARHGVEFATIGGVDYLFKVTSGNNGIPSSDAYSIMERVNINTEIPGDNGYTLAQFLIDNP